MSVGLGLITPQIACLATDTAISDDDTKYPGQQKIFRLSHGGLFAFSGTVKCIPSLREVFNEYVDPNDIPSRRWPAGDYGVLIMTAERALYNCTRREVVVCAEPFLASIGTGGSFASGAFHAMLRGRDLGDLSARTAKRLISEAILLTNQHVPTCGGGAVLEVL